MVLVFMIENIGVKERVVVFELNIFSFDFWVFF